MPPVIGHRGAAARAPENTLGGLRRARSLGCSWVEFDIRLTADGVLVLCHDAMLDRTTNGGGAVSAQPFATIREVDAGAWFGPEYAGEKIPTLEEVLLLAVELGLSANIEIKADPGREYATAAAVAAVLGRRGTGDWPVLVSSFLLPSLSVMQELAPGIPRGVLFRLIPRDWLGIARRLGCAVVGADHRRLTRRQVAEIRAAGYPCAAYTVNDARRARQLYQWGVTSVFSDAPDILLGVDASRGLAPADVVAPQGLPAARQGAMP